MNGKEHTPCRVTLLLVAATIMAPLPMQNAYAQDYSVTDLGVLPGHDYSYAYAINAEGEIVGVSSDSTLLEDHAFLWEDGVMTDLNDLLPPESGWVLEEARDINLWGQIAGTGQYGGERHAYLYDSGTIIDLGTLGGDISEAFGINIDGDVVGWSTNSSGTMRAFYYNGSTMIDLGALGGDMSMAYGINDSTIIVGLAELSPGGPYHAFRRSGSMQDLGTLGGDYSGAQAIGETGAVIGWADRPDGSLRAFIWKPSWPVYDLGVLSGYTDDSAAFGINGLEEVVGGSYDSLLGWNAFLWEFDHMINLNDRVDSMAGWELQIGEGINDDGEIVGSGTHNGLPRAFRARPIIPEACCFSDGSCQMVVPDECALLGGESLGWGSNCGYCPQPQACCLPAGNCQLLQVEDCMSIGGTAMGGGTNCESAECGYAKWWSPPTQNPSYPEHLYGWNEVSWFDYTQIVADDWACLDDRPVTRIRWWGSYTGGWAESMPPAVQPYEYHIAIWTDVPAGGGNPWSHPGTLIWEKVVPYFEITERKVGMDYHPDYGEETCFQYDYIIPESDWFVQNPGSQNVYWLSIAGNYPPCPCDADFNGDGQILTNDLLDFNLCMGQPPEGDCAQADLNCDGVINEDDYFIMYCWFTCWPEHHDLMYCARDCCPGGGGLGPPDYPWGWKTRQPSWNDAAVRITAPTGPGIGSTYSSGSRIQNAEGAWDMAFTLLSETPASPQACCLADETCVDALPWSCLAAGGEPQGMGTDCAGTVPAIVVPPADEDVCDGAWVMFSVTASGRTPLEYQWRVDGLEIPEATEAALTLDPVSSLDAGSYDVVVSNGCGSVTSEAAELVVVPYTMSGDIDGDTRIDGRDISMFVEVVTMTPGSPVNQAFCAADMDQDKDVDADDVMLFVAVLLSQ